ncbi:hypothetical protein ACS0TY_024635 [Phlomoides rotata]
MGVYQQMLEMYITWAYYIYTKYIRSPFVVGAFVQKWGKGQHQKAELRATMKGLTIAFSRGWSRIHLESDSMYVVSAFTGAQSLVIPWWLRA